MQLTDWLECRWNMQPTAFLFLFLFPGRDTDRDRTRPKQETGNLAGYDRCTRMAVELFLLKVQHWAQMSEGMLKHCDNAKDSRSRWALCHRVDGCSGLRGPSSDSRAPVWRRHGARSVRTGSPHAAPQQCSKERSHVVCTYPPPTAVSPSLPPISMGGAFLVQWGGPEHPRFGTSRRGRWSGGWFAKGKPSTFSFVGEEVCRA